MKSSQKLKLVLDTNVYLSGFLFGGTSLTILELIEQKTFLNFFSNLLLSEIESKLTNKFNVSQTVAIEFIAFIKNNSYHVEPLVQVKRSRDPNDDFLLSLSQTCNADYLITGDKDLLVLSNHKNTEILKPSSFIEAVTTKD